MKQTWVVWGLWLVLGWVQVAWAADPYMDHGDSTVTDVSTGLMWQQTEGGAMTWGSALAYCEGLTLAGYTDWRLPNRNEAESLIDFTRATAPTINITYFPNAVSSPYWTSTSLKTSAVNAWRANFTSGTIDAFGKTNSFYVRCVR